MPRSGVGAAPRFTGGEVGWRLRDMTLEQADAGLFVPLQAGSAAALEAAFERYGGLAYGLALRVLNDPGRAEEVVEDVFTTVWVKPGSFDPNRGSFRTWLLT